MLSGRAKTLLVSSGFRKASANKAAQLRKLKFYWIDFERSVRAYEEAERQLVQMVERSSPI